MNEDMEYTYEFLRNCHGLRFRATIADKPQEGIIKVMNEGVMLCYGDEDPGYLVTFGRRDTLSFTKQTFAIVPRDFEIVPRDPKTYKDWQTGDKIIREDIVQTIMFRCGEVVLYKNSNGRSCACPYTCAELFDAGWRLVLTDIEKVILVEKKCIEDIPKTHELKKGDPVLTRNDRSHEWKLRVFEGRVDGSDRLCKATLDGFLYIYQYCIPYNEETMHLLGTTEEPEKL